jgi:hypothetical protein
MPEDCRPGWEACQNGQSQFYDGRAAVTRTVIRWFVFSSRSICPFSGAE